MLLHDQTTYRRLLRRLSLAELIALYERAVCLYAPLAQAVADEMDARLLGECEAPPPQLWGAGELGLGPPRPQ